MSDLLNRLGFESTQFDELSGNLVRIEGEIRAIGDRIYLLRARYACLSARFAHVGERLARLEQLVPHGSPAPSRCSGG